MNTRAAHGRSIVLGVDSADIVLIERWIEAGYLPFFEYLLERTSVARLSTDAAILQGTVWPSLLTGRSAGFHGTYISPQLTTGSYSFDAVRGNRSDLPAFYETLQAGGVRCAVVDIPTDQPRHAFRGTHVVDWLTEFQYWGFDASPPSLKSALERDFGLIHASGGYGPTPIHEAGHRGLVRKLNQSIEMKLRFTESLLARDDLDCVFVVFAEAHKAGHFLWRYQDAANFGLAESDDELRFGLRNVYIQLDAALQRLCAALRPEDNLLVFSDHGMQANNRGEHFVSTILSMLGLCPKASQDRLNGGGPQDSPKVRARAMLRRRLRAAAERLLPQRWVNTMRSQWGAAATISWRQTSVFALSTDRNTYLRVNLEGREPEGIIAPGERYERLLKSLETEFNTLINAETGEPAVEGVYRTQRLNPGPLALDLPDLVIVWNASAPVRILESPTLGRLEIQPLEDRSGNHRPEGFLCVRGPAFANASKACVGDIMQLTPTLLALHGLEFHGAQAEPIRALIDNRKSSGAVAERRSVAAAV